MFVKGRNGGFLRNVNCRKWTVNYMPILCVLLFCYVFSGPYVKKSLFQYPLKVTFTRTVKKSVSYVYDNLAIIYDVCRAIAKTEAIKKAR